MKAKVQYDTRYKTEGYLVTVSIRGHSAGPAVSLGYMNFAFPDNITFALDKPMRLYPEFSPPGQRHPDLWAQQASTRL